MCDRLPSEVSVQEQERYLLALTAVKKAGPITIGKILDFFGNAANAFKARRDDLLRIHGVSEQMAAEIMKMDPELEAERLLNDAHRFGARVLTIFDESYPPLLKEIYDPPPVLYFRGNIDERPKIAVVGTRRASPYGKAVAELLGSELASRGITIVSGLARGIDTSAHRGALEQGTTLSVLGCGFGHLYPRENSTLADSIAERGAVITEFPPDVQPLAENFPRRNRIISGLSVATVVVEAEEKSGALITAGYALEQGREVFAVPGNITSAKSLGPNRLIREGAIPVLSVDDILNELPAYLPARQCGTPEAERKRKEVPLDDDEHTILSIIPVDAPVHIDRLAESSGMSINRLLVAILSLEIKDLVDQLPGNHYIKKLKS